tara:strand:- start:9 stop:323 length:315 start_codon:yes stop_codon:yes gene_type:complete
MEATVAAYIVAQITITDRQIYGKYEAGFMDVFTRYDGRLLSVEENAHVLEGDWSCTRTVLAEFPSKEIALAWYNCAEYQALAPYRHKGSTSKIAVLEGFPGVPS